MVPWDFGPFLKILDIPRKKTKGQRLKALFFPRKGGGPNPFFGQKKKKIIEIASKELGFFGGAILVQPLNDPKWDKNKKNFEK